MIAALILVLGVGLAHPASPPGQLAACEASIVWAVDHNVNLARHTTPGIRHNCGRRAGLSRREVRDARHFATRQITLHNS
jgi:hypothetical protein